MPDKLERIRLASKGQALAEAKVQSIERELASLGERVEWLKLMLPNANDELVAASREMERAVADLSPKTGASDAAIQ